MNKSVAERARAILDLDRLRPKFPARPKIVAIEVEDYVDWTGENALRVLLVLSDNTKDADLSGAVVTQIKSEIHRLLLADGIQEFPYVFLATQRERQDLLAQD